MQHNWNRANLPTNIILTNSEIGQLRWQVCGDKTVS